MATPANRAKIRIVRGDYADIEASISDLVDGELCYAKDQNLLYMVEDGELTGISYVLSDTASETIQDAIASSFVSGTGLDVVYNDSENTITLGLDESGVTSGEYGSSGEVPVLTIDTYGRVTSAETASIDLGLEVGADNGNVETVLLPSETLTLAGGTGIETTTGSNTVTFDLSDTGVSQGTYGATNKVAQITVDAQGRITSAADVQLSLGLDVTGDSGDDQVISLGSETLSIAGQSGIATETTTNGVKVGISDTGVTAGTYGSSSAIPAITVNSRGQITGANTFTIGTSLSVSADSGTSQSISFSTETLSILGGTGLSSTTGTNSVTIDLGDTGVTAGSYGSATAIPTITVDSQGRITSANTVSISTNLDIAGDNSSSGQISLGTETLTFTGAGGVVATITDNALEIKLDDTGVATGSYGSSTAIPTITVDAQGRITSIDTASISTNLSIAGDDSTTDTVSLSTDTLTFTGDANITINVGENTVTVNLDDTAVTAGSYGSTTAIPVIEIDSKGRVTSASTANITTSLGVDGDQGSETIDLATESLSILGGTGLSSSASSNSVTINLDDTSVTTGSYGASDTVGTFTVNQQGQLTAAGSASIAITHAAVTDFDESVREVAGIDQTSEPMGHSVRTDSVISFDSVNRIFSIEPASTQYDVWCKGIKYTKTETESVTLPNTTGLYYIYFNTSGTLSYRVDYFDWENDVPTAYVYWNATAGSAPYIADERHGITLDWATHEYLHRTRGAAIANGFSASNYTLTGDGSLDTHAQIDIGGGTFFDEDLEVQITHSNTPTANTWEQDLQGPAKIPAFYISGTEWVKDTATNFPLKQGTTYPAINSFNGSSWSIVDAGANKYIVSFIIATNNLNEPVIVVLGQGDYSNIGDAEAVQFSDLALDGFPSVEFRPLYKVIFQVGNYANTVNARIRSVIDIRQVSSASVGQAVGSDHGILSGLGDDDHLQYLHVSNTRTGISANVATSGTLSTSNTTASSSSSTGALVVAGGAGIGGDVNIGGDLTVAGTTVTLNAETLVIEDKNIQLGTVETPSNTTAEAGGITLLGGTDGDKTIEWLSSNSAWTSSENIDVATGKAYLINGTSVLNSTTLGSGITGSSLTSVGVIESGTWNGTAIASGYGGTGYTGYTDGELLIGKTDGTLAKSTLSGGTNVTIVNQDGGITVSAVDTTYTAGDGLTLTGTSFSANIKANSGIVIDGTAISLDLSASAISGTLGVADGGTGLTTYTDGQLLIGNSSGSTLTAATLTAGTNVNIQNGNGSITISSTDTTYTAGDGLTLTNTTFSANLESQGGIEVNASALRINLGHTSITGTLATGDGGTGQTTYSNGQLLIGNATGGLSKSTLTAGTNVSIANDDGSITISSTDTTYSAGDGITLTGTSFSTKIKANSGITVDTDGLALDLGASSITGTLGVGDGGTGITSAAKGSVIVANANDTLSALDGGGGSDDKMLIYDASNDTVSWVTELDGGSFVGATP